ncbi:hypothetical protein [Hyphomicrobium sp.]|jgi:hypothetical protein|uniref:hypothetical protein n=1 Tax=Hyphomicrobium sp. TaxID=82 RepID=UPI002C5350DB|nr:hypothetical protein [Hyphomicrobium sp.]HVZ03280.1 hypothetical protein [Hyphomicrobium sp.]
MRIVALAVFVVSLPAMAGSPAHAHKYKRKHTHRHLPRVERDCTPINGFYGYYGNPWCDTGSSRPPDIEFRERQDFYRRYYRAADR